MMNMRYASTSHEQRTATEPRDSEIESVRLKHIKKVNDAIRLITLESTVRHRIIKVGDLIHESMDSSDIGTTISFFRANG